MEQTDFNYYELLVYRMDDVLDFNYVLQFPRFESLNSPIHSHVAPNIITFCSVMCV